MQHTNDINKMICRGEYYYGELKEFACSSSADDTTLKYERLLYKEHDVETIQSDNVFCCAKCKGNAFHMETRQTRAMDEEATAVYCCNRCHEQQRKRNCTT